MITRRDFEVISTWIEPGATVLDLGCGDGALLAYLRAHRHSIGVGIENDERSILACVKARVPVIQSNLEAGLKEVGDGAFDYVILSQTLQAVRRTEAVIDEMLRVGRQVIVTFPNFGYWRHRAQLILRGRMPVSPDLPYQWHDTPNIHLCTVADFDVLCAQKKLCVRNRTIMNNDGLPTRWPNLFGTLALYRLTR